MTQSDLSSATKELADRPEVAEGALAILVTEKEFRYQVSRAGWKTKDIEHAIDTRPRIEGKILLTADDVISRWNPDRETMRRIAQAAGLKLKE